MIVSCQFASPTAITTSANLSAQVEVANTAAESGKRTPQVHQTRSRVNLPGSARRAASGAVAQVREGCRFQNTNRPGYCHRIARYAYFRPGQGAHIVRFCGRRLRKMRITRVFVAGRAGIHVFGTRPKAPATGPRRQAPGAPAASEAKPRRRSTKLAAGSTCQVPPGARPAERRCAP